MSLFKREYDNTGDETLNTINITPLTDCIMVLLIIFMITGSAITQSGFNITLPKLSENEALPLSDITISITDKGTFIVGKETVSAENLTKHLKTARQNTDSVIIYGDKNTSYNYIMHALDCAREAGLTNIGLASASDKSERP